jgi:hypothetical protein
MNSVWEKSWDFPKTHVYELRLWSSRIYVVYFRKGHREKLNMDMCEKLPGEKTFFFFNCFWWTRSPEDSQQWSTIPDNRPWKDWQSTVGWGLCQIRTRDCRFIAWCCLHQATTTLLYTYYFCTMPQWISRVGIHSQQKSLDFPKFFKSRV